MKDALKTTGSLQKFEKLKYITAYDPKIKKRVLHIVKNGKAVSVISGNSFPYNKRVF